MENKSRIIALVLVLVIAGVIGGVVWRNKQAKKELAAVYQQKLAAEATRETEAQKNDEAPASLWQSYVDPDNYFSVSFPGRLDQVTENVAEAEAGVEAAVIYQYEVTTADDTVYFVHKGETPTTSGGAAALKNSLGSFITALGGGILVDTYPVTFAGQPALDFTIQNGSRFIKGSTFFSGDSLYRVGLSYDILKYNRSYEDAFKNSFKLLP